PPPVLPQPTPIAPPQRAPILSHPPEDVAKDMRQFIITSEIVEIGPDGHETILSRPRAYTLDGQQVSIMVGADGLIRGEKEGEIEQVPSGVLTRLKVNSRKDGKLRVDVYVEASELDAGA